MDKIKYANYTQISPERDVTANGFSKGQINFKMNMDSMSRWNPYHSYLRMRVRLSKIDDTPLDENDGIAPGMFQGDTFWQQQNIQCNGVKVSEIDDYVAQVSALKQRYAIPETRRKEFLSQTNFAQARFRDRQKEVMGEGYRQINSSVEQFTNLAQDDATFVLSTEEIRVLVGDLFTIEYRQAADGGIGAVDLTESVLKIGDKIRLNNVTNPNYTGNITAIGVNTITLDRAMALFAAEDILANKILYESVDLVESEQSRRVKDYELCYRPCLGAFSINSFMGGNWKLELTPHTNLRFQRYAIESLVDKTPAVDYKLEVIDLQLYIYKGMASSPKNGMESYDFTEIRCQAQTITSASLLNKAFVVNNNSHTFTIAYQKPDSGDRTDFSKTKFRMLNDYEKRITRYQLRIGGETLPTPLPQIDTDPANNRDFATQQYYETQHYLGSIFLDEPEGLDSWFERGPFYSYVLPKKLNSGANRLYVSQEFAIAPPESFLLLVFDHYYKNFQLQYENGIVKKCIRGKMVN